MKFSHLLWEYLFSFLICKTLLLLHTLFLLRFFFLGIINILKLFIAYVTTNISASIILIFPISLYKPLLYLQIFSVFLVEYLWGFANNTAPHPRLHSYVSIIK